MRDDMLYVVYDCAPRMRDRKRRLNYCRHENGVPKLSPRSLACVDYDEHEQPLFPANKCKRYGRYAGEGGWTVLNRWLSQQIGRPWVAVTSDFHHVIGRRSHTRDRFRNVLQDVALNVGADGRYYDRRNGWHIFLGDGGLYVDANGILCRHHVDRGKRLNWREQRREQQSRVFRVIGERQFSCVDGVWYDTPVVWWERVPYMHDVVDENRVHRVVERTYTGEFVNTETLPHSTRRTYFQEQAGGVRYNGWRWPLLPDNVLDAVAAAFPMRKRIVVYEGQEYTVNGYARIRSKRQLSRRELLAFGLTNA